jgi:hypothetical protein
MPSKTTRVDLGKSLLDALDRMDVVNYKVER